MYSKNNDNDDDDNFNNINDDGDDNNDADDDDLVIAKMMVMATTTIATTDTNEYEYAYENREDVLCKKEDNDEDNNDPNYTEQVTSTSASVITTKHAGVKDTDGYYCDSSDDEVIREKMTERMAMAKSQAQVMQPQSQSHRKLLVKEEKTEQNIINDRCIHRHQSLKSTAMPAIKIEPEAAPRIISSFFTEIIGENQKRQNKYQVGSK